MDRKKLIEQSFTAIDQPEMERIGHVYNPGVLYNSLGITRETLRYYEKQGLICPNKDSKSSYREFTILDIFRLMAIDYYKKHGFAIGEIKELINQDDISQVHEIFSRKQCQLKEEIERLKLMEERLAQDQLFIKNLSGHLHQYGICELPLYEIVDSIDYMSAFSDYTEHVVPNIDLKREDIISNMIREVTFDENGYKESKMRIIKPAEGKKDPEKQYLISGKSIYTVVESGMDDYDTMGRMYHLVNGWACENQLEMKGVVYIRTRICVVGSLNPRNYYECWIPINS